MEAEHRDYLNDGVGSQRQEWIHVAIASHLRGFFPELSKPEALAIVKEFCNDKEKCTPANVTSVTLIKVCGNCKAEYTDLDFEDDVVYMSANLCGSCQESGIVEDDDI